MPWFRTHAMCFQRDAKPRKTFSYPHHLILLIPWMFWCCVGGPGLGNWYFMICVPIFLGDFSSTEKSHSASVPTLKTVEPLQSSWAKTRENWRFSWRCFTTKPSRIHLPGKWQNGHQQSFNLQGISWWLGKNASCIGRMEVIFVLHSKYPSQKELYIYLMLFEKRVRILIDFDVKKRRYQSQTISRTCWKTVESTGCCSSSQIVKIIHFLKGGSTLMALFTFNFPRGPEGESIPPFSTHPNFWCFLFPLLRWRASPIRPHAPNPSWMPRTPIVRPIRRWGRIYDGKNTSWVQIFSRWLFALLWRDVKVYHWKIKISL